MKRNLIKYCILAFVLCGTINCNRDDETKPQKEIVYKYKGNYIGEFIVNNKKVGEFDFAVLRKDDIYPSKFNIDFNYFIVNPSGVLFKDAKISDEGKFSVDVYSYDNFRRENYRGKISGSLHNSGITGEFELTRYYPETDKTKGVISGVKK